MATGTIVLTPTLTDRQFTGQQENLEVGLYYYNARFYVPNTNRWLSPDTIVPDPTNPQSFNRYSYSRNNPINRIDPTGHRDCEFDDYCGPPSATPTNTPAPTVHSFQIPNVVNLNLAIMSPDTPLNVGNGKDLENAETISKVAQSIGAGVDLIEMLFIWNPAVSRAVGFVDVIPAAVSCYYGGECYYGKRHEDLPEMLVVNQDVLINAVDGFLIPNASGKISMNHLGGEFIINEYDYLATTVSLWMDFLDIEGFVPNKISLGFNLTDDGGLGIYVLFYPKTTRE